MATPIITWYATTGTDYQETSDFYAGGYNQNTPLILNVQIWNNRWGTTDVDGLANAVLTLQFNNLEDSALLQCCSCMLRSSLVTGTIKDNIISFPLRAAISGTANDGDANNTSNVNNFVTVKFIFDASGQTIKTNDLKTMYFSVASL